jgi:type II secretory pathway pseudopilin PulG
MIVVVIMAVISAAVGFSVMNAKREADLNIARSGVKTMTNLAEAYVLQNGGRGCPTLADLRAAKIMRAGTEPNDPWGLAYRLECGEDDFNARSAGPDGQFDTADDVSAF